MAIAICERLCVNFTSYNSLEILHKAVSSGYILHKILLMYPL